jgi:ABC-2 type transport system ATP-binding protein
MTHPVIRVDHLTKTYGKARGVEDLSFEVRPGEVFGFLGPNGAGKTTTMRVLLDLLRPTSGRAEVFGMDPRADAPAIHARLGYLQNETGLVGRSSAGEQLRYYGDLRGRVRGGSGAEGATWERVEALAARFQLDLMRPVRQMSRGNKQKVGLVQAFMHDPELLVLDEPTGGLDPLMQQEFNRLVREVKAKGRTIFLSSHILSEVEALCDRVGIIRDGRLVAVERTSELKARAVRHARARFASPPDPRVLDGVIGVSQARVEGNEILCSIAGPTGALVKALAAMDALDLSLREPTLEDVFLAYYGGST